MVRHVSAVLRAAQAKGKVIVASAGPIGVKGEPVAYRPRAKSDCRPWTPARKGFEWIRLTGAECEAVEVRTVRVSPIDMDVLTAEEKLQLLHSVSRFGREYGAELLEEYRQDVVEEALREYRGLNERTHRG